MRAYVTQWRTHWSCLLNAPSTPSVGVARQNTYVHTLPFITHKHTHTIIFQFDGSEWPLRGMNGRAVRARWKTRRWFNKIRRNSICISFLVANYECWNFDVLAINNGLEPAGNSSLETLPVDHVFPFLITENNSKNKYADEVGTASVFMHALSICGRSQDRRN